MSDVFKKDRRFFLKGLGGATLALPIFPSLLTRAEAQSVDKPFVVSIHNFYCPFDTESCENYFPKHGAPGEQTHNNVGYPHPIRSNDLTNTLRTDFTDINGNSPSTPSISRIFDSEFNPYLDKLNIYDGCFFPYYHGHPECMWGNWRETNNGNDFNPRPAERLVAGPTYDMIYANWAYTSDFQGEPAIAFWRERSSTSAFYPFGMAYNYRYPETKSGGIIPVPRRTSVQDYFNYLNSRYFNMGNTNPAAQRNPELTVVDAVYDAYVGMRNNARLSSEDRLRLEEHMAFFQDLRSNLASLDDAQACDAPDGMFNSSLDDVQSLRDRNTLTVAAFRCGITKVFNNRIMWSNTNYGYNVQLNGRDNHNLSHSIHDYRTSDPSRSYEAFKVMEYQTHQVYRHAFLDLIKKMEAVGIGNGKTMGDNCLITIANEHGYNHNNQRLPVATYGKGIGNLRTGKFYDYRRLDKVWKRRDRLSGISPSDFRYALRQSNGAEPGLGIEDTRLGLEWGRFLLTMMHALGLTYDQYKHPNPAGGYYQGLGTDDRIADIQNGNYDFRWIVRGDYSFDDIDRLCRRNIGDPAPLLLNI